jgi:hypothetical protein
MGTLETLTGGECHVKAPAIVPPEQMKPFAANSQVDRPWSERSDAGTLMFSISLPR